MTDLEKYRKDHPLKTAVVNGRQFRYRYLHNPHSDAAIVSLVGGIGLSDLGYNICSRFSEHYSVITFDYPEAYHDLTEVTDAIAELLKQLGISAYFFGQSLGGMIAQIIQKRHPDVVKGLILSNTGSLAREIGDEGLSCFEAMMKSQKKALRLIRLMPFGFLKKSMKKGIEAKIKNNSEEEKEKMRVFVGITMELLTKSYELHMIRLLLDMANHRNASRSDFSPLDGRVLIITADDDATFNDEIKGSLESLMTNPSVKRFPSGGHLAPFFHMEETVEAVTDFIEAAEKARTI